MSALSSSNPAPLSRMAHVLIMTLTFLCLSPPIQAALQAILTACWFALGAGDTIHWTTGIAPRFIWQMLVLAGAMAGLAGLTAGIWETLFGRINAYVMFAISLVIPSLLVIPEIAFLPPFWAVIGSGNAQAMWIYLGPPAIVLLSFVASTMACWKVIEMRRGRKLAPGSSSPR